MVKKVPSSAFFALSVIALGILVFLATTINYIQDKDVDQTKIPPKLEQAKQFQKWITNLKNKGVNVEADEFRLKEENEIYNTNWMTVYNADDPAIRSQYDINILKYVSTKKVVYSPSDRQYIDYRNEPRDGYSANQIHYYGLREDKLVDARLLDCPTNLNCYFDRAYFLDNDVFVVSEISRNLDKRSQDIPQCSLTDTCAYSIKIHLVDLNKNSRLVYESLPFQSNIALLISTL